MIRDLGAANTDTLPEYDVCIVGSGPAGATVARELRGSGLRVCVLESGARGATALGENLRQVESVGLPIKPHSRERVLGGTSTTWAGLSAPLDPVDLAARPWVRSAGWPISASELDAYYRAAAERYRFPGLHEFGPTAPDGFGALKARGSIRPAWSRLEEKLFLAADPPQNFGTEWIDTYESPDTDLWLDATLLELTSDSETRRVGAGRIRSSNGREWSVRAGVFVLAAGGIENARLLLLSRRHWPNGLGNAADQVGRYFMNHPKGNRGVVSFSRPVTELPYYFGCLHRGFAGYAGIRLTEAEQERLGVLNAYVRLEPVFSWTDNPGVDAVVRIAKRSRRLLASWKGRRRDEVTELRSWSETGDDASADATEAADVSNFRLAARTVRHAPSVGRYLYFRLTRAEIGVPAARVRNFMEMEPDPENRVVLSDSRDAFGRQVPRVVYRLTDRDRRSVVALHETLAAELRSSGVGRLAEQLTMDDPWPLAEDASHHMGATRMGVDPRTSVVTPDLRLHEVENVYVAGASVFPSGGCANPTFTLVALSVRLASHLARAAGRLSG